jgi:hypothetical protein
MEQQKCRTDCKYQGTALDLIIQATDARDHLWFDGYFEERLAHDSEFLLELLKNLGSVSKEEVFMIQRMLERLFCQANVTRTDGVLGVNSSRNPDFIRGLVLNIGIIPREKVEEAQRAIALTFC